MISVFKKLHPNVWVLSATSFVPLYLANVLGANHARQRQTRRGAPTYDSRDLAAPGPS